MSLLQTVRTGASLPSPPESTINWASPPQALAAHEAGQQPKREAFVEQHNRLGTLSPGARQKLQDTLALLKQLEHSRTVDTPSLQRSEANLILLKQEVPSDSPEADEIKELEANKTFLRDLVKSRTPNSFSLHAIQSALTLLRQRVYADESGNLVFDEIQAVLSQLKQTGLSDAPSESEATAAGQNDKLRDQKDPLAKSKMNNSSTTGPSVDAEALANEIHRHEQTKRSLAHTETTLEKLYDELTEVKSSIEDFRADRDYLKEQVDELEEAIGDRVKEIQRQEARVIELEADVAPQIAKLEALQRELEKERAEHVMAQALAAHRENAYREAKKEVDALELRVQENAARLEAQNEEMATLQEQLREAREEIAQRDKKLGRAAADKKRLKGTVSQADNHLKETAAVVGDTILTLNSELERIMAAIKDMERTTESTETRRKQKP